MSYYDKSSQVGYDPTDKALAAELEEMLERVPPKVARNLHNRIHDGILQRIREDGCKMCYTLIEALEKCVNASSVLNQGRCTPHRDALNQCYHEVHTEEAYQRYRIMFLRGELLKLHSQRVAARVEGMKAAAPEITATWRYDYHDKLIKAHEIMGTGALATDNVLRDDLWAEHGAAPGAAPGSNGEATKP